MHRIWMQKDARSITSKARLRMNTKPKAVKLKRNQRVANGKELRMEQNTAEPMAAENGKGYGLLTPILPTLGKAPDTE